jgi:hypothetical protein
MAAFLAILDAPLDGLEWQALDSTQRRQRILKVSNASSFGRAKSSRSWWFENLH